MIDNLGIMQSDIIAYTTDQLAEKLSVDAHKIGWYRQLNIIEWIKTGNGYIFPTWSVNEFLHDYAGQDLSTKEKCQIAYAIVQAQKKKH